VLVLLLAGTALFAQATGETASAKLWPKTQPVVYVGFGAGGGTDTAVRPVIAKMEEYLGETINKEKSSTLHQSIHWLQE
jgi:tripartite-type tricarboxylate transporter receptor subunit TctC